MAPGKTWFLMYSSEQTTTIVRAAIKVVYDKSLGYAKVNPKTLKIYPNERSNIGDGLRFLAWADANLSSIVINREALDRSALEIDIPGGGVFLGCTRQYKY